MTTWSAPPWAALIVAAGLAAAASSCSRETQDSTMTSTDSTGSMSGSADAPAVNTDTAAPDSTLASNPGDSARAESLDLIRGQLRAAARRLDQAAATGSMADVGPSALAVRDLAVALVGRVRELPAPKVSVIENDVASVTEILEQLRLHARAGEADAVKAQNSELQNLIARILDLSGPPA